MSVLGYDPTGCIVSDDPATCKFAEMPAAAKYKAEIPAVSKPEVHIEKRMPTKARQGFFAA